MEAEGVVPNGQVKPIIGLVDLFRLHEEGPGVTSRYNNVKLRAGKPVPHRVPRRRATTPDIGYFEVDGLSAGSHVALSSVKCGVLLLAEDE